MKDIKYLIDITQSSIDEAESQSTKNRLQQYLDYIKMVVESDNNNLVS